MIPLIEKAIIIDALRIAINELEKRKQVNRECLELKLLPICDDSLALEEMKSALSTIERSSEVKVAKL